MKRKGKSQNADSGGSVYEAPIIYERKKIIFKQRKTFVKVEIDTFSTPNASWCFPCGVTVGP